MEKRPVYVIGHKNPDTDSICSAIAYAEFKNKQQSENVFIPRRAGHTSPETKYVLKYFGVDKPKYLDTITPRISDVQYRRTEGVTQETTIKEAWQIMKRENLRTLPVFKEKEFVGLITQGDIARYMLEENDDNVLSRANVSCKNILKTIEGTLVVGNEDDVFDNGNVLIGLASPNVMAKHIKKGSMVIIGNREDALYSAIEKGAGWIIVCLENDIDKKIIELARQKGVVLITTLQSSYQVTRLIDEAIPVKHIMHRVDKGDVICFQETDFLSKIRPIMMTKRIRYFPVLAKSGEFKGLISQRNLLNFTPPKVVLVDHNEEAHAVDGVTNADVIDVIDHHRIGDIRTKVPIFFRNQPVGATATIVYHLFVENKVEISPSIAGLMCAAIISDTLCFKSPTTTYIDKQVAQNLAEMAGIEIESFAEEMFKAGAVFDDKTEEEIFYQDFKTFSVEGHTIGVGQVNIIGEDIIERLKTRMIPFMQDILKRTHHDIIVFIMTNILTETSEIIYLSSIENLNAKLLIENAFEVKAGEFTAIIPGLVSRKKQFMPKITMALQAL